MKTRQEHIDFDRNYCVHYNPHGPHSGCDAGMDRTKIQVVQVEGGMKWGPCMGGHTLADPLQHCPKWERRSLEHAEARADDIEKCMQRMAVVGPVIRQWRQKQPRGKAEVIECPACKGQLHLSQAACNGHVRARCETAGCVNFIE